MGGHGVEGMRVVDRSANPRADRRLEHHRQLPVAVGRPVDAAGELEQVDRIEDVVAELDFGDRSLSREGETDRGADDAALVERTVPGGLEPLGGGEHAAQRWADVLPEDVLHPEVFLGEVERHSNGLGHARHRYFFSAKTCSQMDSGLGWGSLRTSRAASARCVSQRARTSSICTRERTPFSSSHFSYIFTQSGSSATKFAPEADECP